MSISGVATTRYLFQVISCNTGAIQIYNTLPINVINSRLQKV